MRNLLTVTINNRKAWVINMDSTNAIANDFHGQYRDKKTCQLFFDFLRREKPDRVILAGDIGDFYTISKFDKDPARKETLQDELNEVYNEILWPIRDILPSAEIAYELCIRTAYRTDLMIEMQNLQAERKLFCDPRHQVEQNHRVDTARHRQQ